jgi:hypothetical protein
MEIDEANTSICYVTSQSHTKTFLEQNKIARGGVGGGYAAPAYPPPPRKPRCAVGRTEPPFCDATFSMQYIDGSPIKFKFDKATDFDKNFNFNVKHNLMRAIACQKHGEIPKAIKTSITTRTSVKNYSIWIDTLNLNGTFRLLFDTTNCLLCSVKGSYTTGVINALDPASLERQLIALQNIGRDNISVVYQKNNSIKSESITWDVVFDSTSVTGNVPQLYVFESFLSGDEAILSIETLVEGNEIKGAWTLGWAGSSGGNYPVRDSIPRKKRLFRARENSHPLQDWLFGVIKVYDLFDVQVSTELLHDGVGGFEYNVTFVRTNGNISPLLCDAAYLWGQGNINITARCDVETLSDGLYLGGSFFWDIDPFHNLKLNGKGEYSRLGTDVMVMNSSDTVGQRGQITPYIGHFLFSNESTPTNNFKYVVLQGWKSQIYQMVYNIPTGDEISVVFYTKFSGKSYCNNITRLQVEVNDQIYFPSHNIFPNASFQRYEMRFKADAWSNFSVRFTNLSPRSRYPAGNWSLQRDNYVRNNVGNLTENAPGVPWGRNSILPVRVKLPNFTLEDVSRFSGPKIANLSKEA